MGTIITLRTALPPRACFTASRHKTAASIPIPGAASHRDLTALLAVDLNHQRHRVFNQQIAFDFRPIGLRNQTGLSQHLPALLGQMRHHGREQLNKNDRGLADRPGEIR